MNRNILVKSVITILSVFILTLSLGFIRFEVDETIPQDVTPQPIFQNNVFDTTLTEPDVSVEEFISISDIYLIVDSYMNAETQNDSNEVKDARDLAMSNAILSIVGERRVSIETAEELYHFGNMQSFNYRYQASINRYPYKLTMETILSLDYVLLADIDYSTMRSRKFIPIGTNIDVEIGERVVHDLPFTGTFDGMGHTISNLYLADYNYITTILQFDGDETTNTDIPLFKHYSMFSYVGEDAVIKNLILYNPIYELLDAPNGLSKTSMFVGENYGTIYNIGVIDEKVTQLGVNNSGIRFNLQHSSSETFTAAGFVHTNYGTIQNSYFVAENILVSGSRFRFHTRPFAYIDEGTIEGVAYADIVHNTTNDITPMEGITAYTTLELKNGTKNNQAISINSVNIPDEPKWNFYYLDSYPSLISLEYDEDENEFLIKDEYDLVAFTKLINLLTPVYGKTFDLHTYRIVDHINMTNIKTLKTTQREFKGVLYGGNNDFSSETQINENKYIFNLDISVPFIQGSQYYLGLIGLSSGIIQNINLYNNKVTVTNSNDHYGKTIYVGGLVAYSTGTIKNVIADVNVNLGTDALGKTYVGGIAGVARGLIYNTANIGHINGNTHDFKEYTVDGNIYIGGIIGSNVGSLTMYSMINQGLVSGIGSTTTTYNALGIQIYVGGIIGEINNDAQYNNSFKYLTNLGTIESLGFSGTENIKSKTYLGGIFGSLKGNGFVLYENNQIKNGRFENKGTIEAKFMNTYTYVYGAGIGNTLTSEELADVSYMINSGTYNYATYNYRTHNTYLFYAATILDHSEKGITLSRAYNTTNFTFGHSFFNSNHDIEVNEIKIAPFFYSLTNKPSKLLYVENKGNLTVGSSTETTNVEVKLKISNITQSTFIDYQNVINSGHINVLKLNGVNDAIYVSGITWVLPYDTRPFKMENVLNEGRIVTADILSDTSIDTYSGVNYSNTDFSSTLTTRNLYVAGLVNLNAGEIINVFNRGTLTSKYSNLIKDIDGTANTFVGGIVTFNYHLIQDAANSGLIEYTNSNTSAVAYFAGTNQNRNNNSSTFGGATIAYNGGLTLGGIVAAIGNNYAKELENYGRLKTLDARILDTANSGDVYGKSRAYVRSGGVLGVALGIELASGTHNNTNRESEVTDGPFARSIIGPTDTIGQSMLSNGLNFGNIYAITKLIGEYTGSLGTGSGDTNANTQRPGINSSAGGVIAYGLTKMKRMLNHGVVTATDVAGGVIGATYIVGISSSSGINTYVDIDTAVHYGKVKAAKVSGYDSFEYDDKDDFNKDNLVNHEFYYIDNDTTFVFANTQTYDLARYPNKKRGFGGIFGRMQRGINGNMVSNNFINILNMDPNVDLIGRADQQEPGSIIRYRFFNGNPDGYYTARVNDTTAMAVVGWIRNYTRSYVYKHAETLRLTIRRTSSSGQIRYHVVGTIQITNGTGDVTETHERAVMYYNRTSSTYQNLTRTIRFIRSEGISSGSRTTSSYETMNDISRYNINPQDIAGYFTGNDQNYTFTFNNVDIENDYAGTRLQTLFNRTLSGGGSYLRYYIENVSDDPLNKAATYIFDDEFPLMHNTNSEYIYHAEKDVLAENFQDGNEFEKPDGGMYVLASTKGRQVGAVLPSNIQLHKLYRLNENYEYIDLNDVNINQVVSSGTQAEALLNDYRDMLQISYNDKSAILSNSGASNLADLVLYDPDGIAPMLQGGTLNDATKTITFTIAADAFPAGVNNFNYKVLSAETSENAVIAKNNILISEHTAFKAAYNNRTSNIIKTSAFETVLTGSVAAGSSTDLTLTVYSEIAANDNNLLHKYKTEYTIRIVRQSQSIVVTKSFQLNGNYTTYLEEGNVITLSGELEAPYKLKANFIDSNNRLPLGHTFYVHGLMLGNEIIDSSYYTVTHNAKDSSNQLSFEVQLSDQLIDGTYQLIYSYYQGSQLYYVNFEKTSSKVSEVRDIEYSTMSIDFDGNSQNFIAQSSNFVTYIRFGYLFQGITKNEIELDIDVVDDENAFDYVDNVLYYELSYDGKIVIDKLVLAPFIRLHRATIKYEYLEDGRLVYKLVYETYHMTDENSITSIEHDIEERKSEKMDVYVDDNYQLLPSFDITREALQTRIDINFKFIDENMNHQVLLVVTKDGENYPINPNEIKIEPSFYYHMIITAQMETGLKTYAYYLQRDEETFYYLGSLDITKKKDINAYLQNIEFQIDSGVAVVYPEIKALDPVTLTELSEYDTRIYFDGIDYAGSDLAGHEVYRIDGKVSDILLDFYAPNFTLPFGAKIERFDGENWVSELRTNFEGNDSSEVVVLYRISSEEENYSEVYYYITVSDIKYNLTIKFSIYYQIDENTIISAESMGSPILNKVVLIQMKNLKLHSSFNAYDLGYDPNNYVYPDVLPYIEGIQNQSSLFYFTALNNQIIYRFGRNMSGAYNFNIIPPIYQGETEGSLIQGERYQYTMYLKENGVEDWFDPKYELPELDSEGLYTGKYFFILSQTTRPITREFAIVIKPITQSGSWGLNDENTSWDQ